jgi:hypothetical protein
MNKKNLLLIAVCAILLLLVYMVDLFKLNYRMADWNEFGDAPVTVSHVQYFVADTPNIITYLDRDLGQNVTCFEAVAFVQAGTQETYRCCDADGMVSCLEGDFSSDIPSTDEQCVAELRQIFDVPETLTASKEYQFFGKCSGGRFAELTVVQLDESGKIRWKHVKVDTIQVVTSALRCVLGPVLLVLIFYVLYKFYQERTAQPVRRI